MTSSQEIRADGWQDDVGKLRRQVADLVTERREDKQLIERLQQEYTEFYGAHRRVSDERDELRTRLAAEQEAMNADLRQLLDALGLFSGARPQSSHEVMQEAIAEAARLRNITDRERLIDVLTQLQITVATTGPAAGMIIADSMADAILRGLGATA